MNKEELQQKIAYYYSKLPAHVQGMFASMSWLETLKRISAKYGLNDQQIETLGTETTLVLLGIIRVEEYQSILTNELGLRGENLENLLMEINGLVLNPVRVELGKAYEMNITEEPPQATPAPQQETVKKEEPVKKPGYADALLEVSRKHGLSVTQMGVLEGLVKGVFDGSGDATKFEQALEKGAWLSREKAHEVTVDLNEQVFKSIRQEMMAGAADADRSVLKSAGIELTPEKPKVEFQTPKIMSEREDVLKKIENPELLKPERELPPASIHEQKLAGSFVIPKKETHYEEPAPKPATGPDPYREPIK